MNDLVPHMLYEIEEELEALANTEEMLAPDQEEAFRRELALGLERATFMLRPSPKLIAARAALRGP